MTDENILQETFKEDDEKTEDDLKNPTLYNQTPDHHMRKPWKKLLNVLKGKRNSTKSNSCT